MFEQIVKTSFYGSMTPYVRGKFVKTKLNSIEFRMSLTGLSSDEIKFVEEVLKGIEEDKSDFLLKGVVVGTAMINGNEVTFPIENVTLKEPEVIAQATIRMDVVGSNYTHFQMKINESDEGYEKADIHCPKLTNFIGAILNKYGEAQVKDIPAEKAIEALAGKEIIGEEEVDYA